MQAYESPKQLQIRMAFEALLYKFEPVIPLSGALVAWPPPYGF